MRAKALSRAGVLAQVQGDYDEAERLHEQGLALRRELSDEAGVTVALHNLGILAGMRGDYTSALRLLEETLALNRKLGDQQGISNSLMNLGITARRQGELDRAVTLYEESLTLGRAQGNTRLVATALQNLGNRHLDQNASERAALRYREGLALYQELQDRLGAARCLAGLAEIAAIHGDMRRAAQLSGAATGLRTAIGVPLPPDGRSRSEWTATTARAALDEAEFMAAWAAGAALSLEEATAAALSETAPA